MLRRRRRIERNLALVIWLGFLGMFFLMLFGFAAPLYYQLAQGGKPGGSPGYFYVILFTSGVCAGTGVAGLLGIAVFKLRTWLVPVRKL